MKRKEISGIPIVDTYKYLGINLNVKLNIKRHIGIINAKVDEYSRRSYVLNLNYFSVKSIMILFSYYHRSRLYYGLACFAEQKNNIQKVERVLLSTILREC